MRSMPYTVRRLTSAIVGGHRPIRLARDAQGNLIAIIGNSGGMDEEEDDDNDVYSRSRRRTRWELRDPNRFPKVPDEKGRELMDSGIFGACDTRDHDRKRLARRILDRELAIGNRVDQRENMKLIAQVWYTLIHGSSIGMLTLGRNWCRQQTRR
jgi:hypothetical protein